MTDVAMDLVRYLRQLGVDGNTNFQWIKTSSLDGADIATTFVNNLPDTPDQAMVATKYSGAQADETFSLPFQVRHPRVQFMIRDPDSNVALDRLEQIMLELGKIKDQLINGTKYQRVKEVGEPEEIGPDSSDRQRASLNMTVSFYG